jgi:hypothetical protein
LEDSIFYPPFLPRMLTKPRILCFCQPVAFTISASVTPLARFIIAILRKRGNGHRSEEKARYRYRLPLSVAMQIASADEAGVQEALCAAYDDKTLHGPQTPDRSANRRRAQGQQ